jgi:hypothetical protein
VRALVPIIWGIGDVAGKGTLMSEIFHAMSSEARQETRTAYRQFLLARDGVLDMEKRTLSQREEAMFRYSKPLTKVRELDRRLFEAQYSAYNRALPTSPETLLLLTLVKVNAAEAYGVSATIENALQQASRDGDALELTLLVEELYHTRILLSSALLYGLEVTAPYQPPAGFRAVIFGIGRGPEFISRPIVLAGEVLGSLLFLNLLKKAGEVLRYDPELRDAVEERICEVMIDELGHISYNRTLLGSRGLARTRAILPLVRLGLGGAVPEVTALGVMPSGSESELALLEGGRGLPDHVRRAAFIA